MSCALKIVSIKVLVPFDLKVVVSEQKGHKINK